MLEILEMKIDSDQFYYQEIETKIDPFLTTAITIGNVRRGLRKDESLSKIYACIKLIQNSKLLKINSFGRLEYPSD